MDTGDGQTDAKSGKDSGKDAIAPSGPKYVEEVLADRPVGYWRLGDGSGTTARDHVGAHAGTYERGFSLGVAGVVSNDTAAWFDGQAGSRVRIGDVFDFPDKASCTLEVWVKWDGGHAGYVIAKKSSIDGTGYSLLASPLTGDSVLWVYSRTLRPDLTDAVQYTAPKSPRFAHVVATYDGTKGRIFFNGVEANSANFGLNLPGNSAILALGSNSGGDGAFNGTLDEVAIYDHALPLARIQTHYQAANSK